MRNKFKKGNIPWNKGKHWSNKIKKKQSETKKRLFKEGKLKPSGKKIFITKEKLNDLYWNRGLTTKQIGDKFNADKSAVYLWLKKYNIPRKKLGHQNKKFSLTKEELHDLYYNKNMTMQEIANETNVTIGAICRWMKIYGIPSRTISHWMSREKNPSWKGGLAKVICKNCGKEFERPKCHVTKYNSNFCSDKCKYEYRVGKNASNWKGGISFEPYSPDFNKKLKRQIRERDNHTCQECGKTKEELGYEPAIHHIDYDKNNNNPNNLICLCNSCHGKTTYDRNDWTRYFREKLLKRLEQNNN